MTLVVGWQATQKLNFINSIRKTIFVGMFVWVFGIWWRLRIYDERFHLPNQVIKILFWATGHKGQCLLNDGVFTCQVPL